MNENHAFNTFTGHDGPNVEMRGKRDAIIGSINSSTDRENDGRLGLRSGKSHVGENAFPKTDCSDIGGIHRNADLDRDVRRKFARG
jgi:hypothetical protein